MESLKRAQIKLDSVKSWVTIDGFGGSLLISIVKHTKIDETLHFLEQAKKLDDAIEMIDCICRGLQVNT